MERCGSLNPGAQGTISRVDARYSEKPRFKGHFFEIVLEVAENFIFRGQKIEDRFFPRQIKHPHYKIYRYVSTNDIICKKVKAENS